MIGFLRFVGIMNAAVWFGAGIFFTFAIAPAIFSPDMEGLLGPKNYPYFSGAIAEIFVARYFHLQVFCGIVALLQLLGERLYFGKFPHKLALGLLLALFSLGLLGGCWLQPRLKQWHKDSNFNSSPAIREAAGHSFRTWHGVSQALNLLVLAGLGLYLWRLANRPDSTRFLNTAKFRG